MVTCSPNTAASSSELLILAYQGVTSFLTLYLFRGIAANLSIN
jgi:hypothetical protein